MGAVPLLAGDRFSAEVQVFLGCESLKFLYLTLSKVAYDAGRRRRLFFLVEWF